MTWIILAAVIIVSGAIFNAWLIRNKVATAYRGGDARTMKEEFKVYGLPDWFFYLVGFLKISCALSLVAGIFYSQLLYVGAAGLGTLMLGAVIMHFKVGDPVKKSMPAATLLVLCLLILALTSMVGGTALAATSVAINN